MYGSKREQLVDGLIRLATTPFLALAPVGPAAGGSVLLLCVVLFLLAATAVGGATRVMEALFGEDGLLLDVSRSLLLAELRADRLEGKSGKYRLTSPSLALRDRGAGRRLIGVRRK
ncbi:MAG TPA: hypothetical protein VM529_18135 [Gemmata sp.]|nr:hypothetical protein [Gemmata sp.]